MGASSKNWFSVITKSQSMIQQIPRNICLVTVTIKSFRFNMKDAYVVIEVQNFCEAFTIHISTLHSVFNGSFVHAETLFLVQVPFYRALHYYFALVGGTIGANFIPALLDLLKCRWKLKGSENQRLKGNQYALRLFFVD